MMAGDALKIAADAVVVKRDEAAAVLEVGAASKLISSTSSSRNGSLRLVCCVSPKLNWSLDCVGA